METKTLKQMKGSEIHRIVAAVLEVMEKAQFDTQVDVALQLADTKEDGAEDWKMVFQKKETSLDELNGIKGELGKNFSVTIGTKDKTALLVIIKAPAGDFVALAQRKPTAIPSRTMFDNQQHNT